MLSAHDNRLLTRVGPGTPMGRLLRRYWHPIAAAASLDATPIQPIRILGEDLVLYRDGEGNLGLLDRRCPHRGADLALGTIEACGLRCSYHGWRFDRDGRCLEQPFEQVVRPGSSPRASTTAYPVAVKAGMIWAYLGPEPAPCLWDWALFHERGYQYVRYTQLACNWFQCQENAIDPIHFEWLHENWSRRLTGDSGYAAPHQRLRFEEFEFGFTYHRLREGMDETDPAWTIGRVCLWPNGFVNEGCSWRVPIDDDNTLYILWDLAPIPGTRPVEQERVPAWRVHATPPVAQPWAGEPGLDQDFAAMSGQGVIADRSREQLGESDRGIILMRKRFLDQLRHLDSPGFEPKGLVRDPQQNHRLPLPMMPRTAGVQMRGVAPPEVADEIERMRRQHAER